MAGRRGRTPGFIMPECYVYRIFDGDVTVYVGKGSGRRLQSQERRFGLSGEILERCKNDDHAFEREVHWIETLQPTDNICPGGNGGRVRPKRKPRKDKMMVEIDRVGSRRYAARFLLSRMNVTNCRQYGVDPETLARLASVANGPAV
jgi:hypothetical protein